MSILSEWLKEHLSLGWHHSHTQSAKNAEEKLDQAEKAIEDAKKSLRPYTDSPDPLQALVEDLYNKRQMGNND